MKKSSVDKWLSRISQPFDVIVLTDYVKIHHTLIIIPLGSCGAFSPMGIASRFKSLLLDAKSRALTPGLGILNLFTLLYKQIRSKFSILWKSMRIPEPIPFELPGTKLTNLKSEKFEAMRFWMISLVTRDSIPGPKIARRWDFSMESWGDLRMCFLTRFNMELESKSLLFFLMCSWYSLDRTVTSFSEHSKWWSYVYKVLYQYLFCKVTQTNFCNSELIESGA